MKYFEITAKTKSRILTITIEQATTTTHENLRMLFSCLRFFNYAEMYVYVLIIEYNC